MKPNGSYVTGNDPADTSKPIGPDFVSRWMAHLAGRVGTAAAGGVRLWALDNEPFLWNSTHHDVHPAGVSYDELWAKTTSIARRDQGARPEREGPRSRGLGLVRVFLFRRRRLLTGSGSCRARGRGLPPVVPRPGEGVGNRAREPPPRLPRRPLLPSGLRRRPHERRVGRDVRPPAENAQEPVRPDVPRRVVDRHGRRPGRVPDPADEGVDRGALPRHEARDQRVQLGLGRRDQRRPRAGRGARDLRTRGRGPRHAVGRARRELEDRGRVPPLPQLRRGGSRGERRQRARHERERGRRRRVRRPGRRRRKHALHPPLQQGHGAADDRGQRRGRPDAVRPPSGDSRRPHAWPPPEARRRRPERSRSTSPPGPRRSRSRRSPPRRPLRPPARRSTRRRRAASSTRATRAGRSEARLSPPESGATSSSRARAASPRPRSPSRRTSP